MNMIRLAVFFITTLCLTSAQSWASRDLFSGGLCENSIIGLILVDSAGDDIGSLPATLVVNDGSQYPGALVIDEGETYSIRVAFTECSEDPIAQMAWMYNGQMLGGDPSPPYAVGSFGYGGSPTYELLEGSNTIVASPVSVDGASGPECAHTFDVILSTEEPTRSPTPGPTSGPTTEPSSTTEPTEGPTPFPTALPTDEPTPSPTGAPTQYCECCETAESFPDVPENLTTYEEVLEYLDLDPNVTIPDKEPVREEWRNATIEDDCSVGECPVEEPEELVSTQRNGFFHVRRRMESFDEYYPSQNHRQLNAAMNGFKRLVKAARRSPFKLVTCCTCSVGTATIEGICLLNNGAGKAFRNFNECMCDLLKENVVWEAVCDDCLSPLAAANAIRNLFGCP